MKAFFAKRNSKLVAVLLTFAVLLASFAWAVPVNAETTADMQKAVRINRTAEVLALLLTGLFLIVLHP